MKIKWEFSECQLNWVINNFNWGNHLRKWMKCERLLSICCLKPRGFKQQVATRHPSRTVVIARTLTRSEAKWKRTKQSNHETRLQIASDCRNGLHICKACRQSSQ